MEHSKLPHSKLPWYTSDGIEHRGIRNEDGFICFLKPRPIHYQDQDERYERELREWEGDARFIREACKEHYTLKAKEALFEEAIKTCRECFVQGGKIVPMMTIIDSYADKAKKLL